MESSQIALHQLGWKAFQDLCVALVEERLGKQVQTFLPSSDAGRDGAFLGIWDGPSDGESTIQCKFTSKADKNLTLSSLADELPKAKRLAQLGLAKSYVILTNYGVTGESELAIKKAFVDAGVGSCRVFHRDWIVARIQDSARLRMMVPRLYGFADLTTLLDTRAYQQAKLILSEMGGNLQKLVVTDAYRQSVRAIDEHRLVLLLGSPAAGKSTIGASLAVGANDRWQCLTIKSTSPEHLQKHLDHKGGQFFWIDDAWGSTQYQRDRTEGWNQVFPLMQSALQHGTRFLFTSRDYIWKAARSELKLQALPTLKLSQVVINVQKLSVQEKAKILYNHLKLGDQPTELRTSIKPFLPIAANHSGFLPETARRLGAKIFTKNLDVSVRGIDDFVSRPTEFLEDTIENLSDGSKAAIALVFLNGGKIRSPVPQESLVKPSQSFGVTPAELRDQLLALDGSFLNGAEDEEGPYWTYSHPTVSDAFASFIGKSPEQVEIYLSGAKAENLLNEVVCSGVVLAGAKVKVPNSLHPILLDRIASLPNDRLASFISYRSNKIFSEKLLAMRPDILDRLDTLYAPLRDDFDVPMLTTLHKHGLLDEQRRQKFIECVRRLAVEHADDSFITNSDIASVLTEDERALALADVKAGVLDDIQRLIDNRVDEWNSDYDPSSHFDELESSIKMFINSLSNEVNEKACKSTLSNAIRKAIWSLEERYTPPEITESAKPSSTSEKGPLDALFRDVDE